MNNFFEFFLRLEWQHLVPLVALCVVLLFDLLLFVCVFWRVLFVRTHGVSRGKDATPRVSVVVCLRDSAEELLGNLPLFLSQDYPDYEVVVVDDASQDEHTFALERLRREHSNLRITNVKSEGEFLPNRKLSLTVGIKAAQGEWVLLTEPRCRPAGEKWISTMARNFSPDVDLVLGYSGFRRGRSFVSTFQRAERRWQSITRLGFAMFGRLTIPQRQNFAFRRTLFFENRGYAGFNHLQGGEDDLFALNVAKPGRTRVEVARAAQTFAIPLAQWAEVRRERRAYRIRRRHFPLRTRLVLNLEPTARILIWAFALCLIVSGGWLLFVGLGAILCRRIFHALTILMSWHHLKGRGVLFGDWLYDLISPFLALRPLRERMKQQTYHSWR